MKSATRPPEPTAKRTWLAIVIFALVLPIGLLLVLFGDGSNTGFVYGNV